MNPSRNHKAAYARRQARARALGFASDYQLRKFGGAAAAAVNTGGAFRALPPDAQASRQTALRVLSTMRVKGEPLDAAAAAAQTTPAAVRFWVGAALTSGKDRAKARKADRLYRAMRVITADGVEEIDVRGSGAASTLGAYWNAVHHYLATGDARPLAAFRGVRVAGVELAADPDLIEHWAHVGELAFESIYRTVA